MHLYSNAGFALVGAVLECRTGVAWETLMQDHLWKPLGIESGSFGAPGTRGAQVPDAPHGHTAEDCTPIEPGPGSDNPATIGPAGTAAMTVRDWARYLALHLEGEGPAPRLLSTAAFRRLHTPLPHDDQAYAMGWLTTEQEWGGRLLVHNGDNTLWHCISWLSLSKEFAVLVTTNRSAVSDACNEVVIDMIQDHHAHEGRS
jgi:CubicO group peptidase (beta-lactamase class C family)